MSVAPNIQIGKLRSSEAKGLDHIHMACQWQNWTGNQPALALLRVGGGQWLGQLDNGR